jgi:hypothetical protein
VSVSLQIAILAITEKDILECTEIDPDVVGLRTQNSTSDEEDDGPHVLPVVGGVLRIWAVDDQDELRRSVNSSYMLEASKSSHLLVQPKGVNWKLADIGEHASGPDEVVKVEQTLRVVIGIDVVDERCALAYTLPCLLACFITNVQRCLRAWWAEISIRRKLDILPVVVPNHHSELSGKLGELREHRGRYGAAISKIVATWHGIDVFGSDMIVLLLVDMRVEAVSKARSKEMNM